MTWYLQLSQGIVTADVRRCLIWCSFYAAPFLMQPSYLFKASPLIQTRSV